MASSGAGWSGVTSLGLGWAAFSGRSGDNTPHRHHAYQIALGLQQPVTIEHDDGATTAPAVLIQPNVRHRLRSMEHQLLLYVEAESTLGRAMRQLRESPVQGLSAQQAAAVRAAFAAGRDVAAALQPLLGARPQRPPEGDALIAGTISRLPSPPRGLSAASLAREAGLSASRFAHRFVAHTGMPLRPFLRWRRMLAAAEGLGRAEALTDVALNAGFADAAHMTRTFRAHFGISPRELRRLLDGPAAGRS